jgi:hypothetical protein
MAMSRKVFYNLCDPTAHIRGKGISNLSDFSLSHSHSGPEAILTLPVEMVSPKGEKRTPLSLNTLLDHASCEAAARG